MTPNVGLFPPSEKPARSLQFVVAGAVVLDCFADIPRFPNDGENVVRASRKRRDPGGNGANQANALGLLDHRAVLVATVGKDGLGRDLLTKLRARRVGTAFIERRPGMETPICEVFLKPNGNNAVIWGLEPEERPSPDTIRQAIPALGAADAVLATFELPAPALTELIDRAEAQGLPVFLNAGPAQSRSDIADVPLNKLHTLICNGLEAQTMLGIKDWEVESGGPDLAQLVAEEYGVGRVCVTYGPYGVSYWEDGQLNRFHAFEASQVDPTGAGDAFAAAYAAFTMEGYETDQAITYALISAALTVERSGAIDSFPTREEIIGYVRDPSDPLSEKALARRQAPRPPGWLTERRRRSR